MSATEEPDTPLEAVRGPDSAMSSAPTFAPPAHIRDKAVLQSLEAYQAMYNRSIADPTAFWDEQATKELSWVRPYSSVVSGSFQVRLTFTRHLSFKQICF